MTERSEGTPGARAPASRTVMGPGGAAPEQEQSERSEGTPGAPAPASRTVMESGGAAPGQELTASAAPGRASGAPGPEGAPPAPEGTVPEAARPAATKPAAGRRSRINPVLGRELRGRMRGWRAPIIITVWLLATVAVSWLVYTANGVSEDDPFANPFGNADLGRGIFDWVLLVMMVVILFLIPGQAAGAIAGERDRQTLVPLQVSLLSPRQLLFGKIAASSAFIVLLMVAAMPVLAVAYVIGGVRISEIIVGLTAVVATGVLLAAMVTAISALAKRVQGAVVLSYLLVFGLTIGPVLAYGVAALIDGSRGSDETDPPEWLLVPDPFVAVGDIAGDRFSGSVASPWDGIWSVLHPDRDEFVDFEGGGFPGEVVVDGQGIEIAPPLPPPVPIGPGQVDAFPAPVAAPAPEGGDGVPYWVRSLGAQAALALLLLVLAARRLRTPALVER